MRFYTHLCSLLILFFCLLVPTYGLAGKDDWKPIGPAELALKAPIVEKTADAEAIFWEIHVQDEVNGGTPRTVLTNYIRIKIFTDRGRESQSQIDLPYLDSDKITDIAARTIKADGTIVELKKDAIFERTIVKTNGGKIKAKSFAMPAVEAGAIIEYRWQEVRGDQISQYTHLQLQRDIPVQLVKYYIKPISIPGFDYGMRAKTFHGETTPFVQEKDGFSSTSMSNVPAFHEEPYMPPDDEARAWMLIYYTPDKKLTVDQFWMEHGKEIYEKNKDAIKVTNEVKQMAISLIGTASTPKDKLDRLLEFCRTKIKNSRSLPPEERAKLKENKTPGDTLKRGVGTTADIDLLFAAMANVAGFDARIAMLADRSSSFFNRNFPNTYFLNTYDIAVKVDNDWQFFDPGSSYLPIGMLRWQEEGQDALITDPKQPTFVRTPISEPEKSTGKRVGKFSLSDDGTLEGDVKVEYTGHLAVDNRNREEDGSLEQREQSLKDRIKQQMSTAEISNIHIENLKEPDKPYAYSYHVKVTGYAQRTGKRLFVQPAYFQKGLNAIFPTSDRKYPIYFHYPWAEDDLVEINLPTGFALDNANAPDNLGVKNVSKYSVKILVTEDGKTLIYRRSFFFGSGGAIIFPPTAYTGLKQVFDLVHERDNHIITLKLNAATTN